MNWFHPARCGLYGPEVGTRGHRPEQSGFIETRQLLVKVKVTL